mgnify:CR=1 FL=1
MLAKVLSAGNALLIAAITLTGVLTYRVARDAVRRELVAAGGTTVSHFARANALEWLDEQEGKLNLRLRAQKLLDSDPDGGIVAAYLLDKDGAPMLALGAPAESLPPLPKSFAKTPVTLDARTKGTIDIAAPVLYSGVQLGVVVLSFDDATIDQAGRQILTRTGWIMAATIALNLLGLAFWMRRLLHPVVSLGKAASEVARGNYTHRIQDTLADDEVGTAARSFNDMCDALELHMRFSNAALVNCIRQGENMERAQTHQLSIIFGDVQGYTTWAEHHSPQDVFQLLSRYYTCFGRITVRRFHGIIDKFMGDGVMAHFGLNARGDEEQYWYVRAALRATIYSQLALRLLSHLIRTVEARQPLAYRFGIATGKSLVGALGAQGVMLDYSPIGNVVNLASRLEGMAPPGGLVIDRFTYIDAGADFLHVEPLGPHQIKGIAQPIELFAVRGFAQAQEIEQMQNFLGGEFFDNALDDGLLVRGTVSEAKRADLRALCQSELQNNPWLPLNDGTARDG